MIGHIFASSGATCLALAPSAERPDEYIVLASTENGYAVANIMASALGQIGGPKSWMQGSYYDLGGHGDADLWSAVCAFADLTWGETITGALDDKALAERMNVLVGHVRHAEDVVDHRAHLARL